MVGLVIAGVPLVWRTLRGVARGHFATDVVASLAILAAIPLGEPLAGLIVVLMQTGGEALEFYAQGRASRAVRALEADAPRFQAWVRARLDENTPYDQFVERILTVVQTCRLNEAHPLEYLAQAVNAHRSCLDYPKLLAQG